MAMGNDNVYSVRPNDSDNCDLCCRHCRVAPLLVLGSQGLPLPVGQLNIVSRVLSADVRKEGHRTTGHSSVETKGLLTERTCALRSEAHTRVASRSWILESWRAPPGMPLVAAAARASFSRTARGRHSEALSQSRS